MTPEDLERLLKDSQSTKRTVDELVMADQLDIDDEGLRRVWP